MRGNEETLHCLLPMHFMLLIAFYTKAPYKIELCTRNTAFVPNEGGRITVYLTENDVVTVSINMRLQCTYLVRTMETASLRILSPKTNMLSTGSTLRALKMAIVATGSTADIKEPNAKLGEHKRGN